MNLGFWKGKRVFITGHTGFKGSWLSLWLQSLGSIISGYALPPITSPSLFKVAHVLDGMNSVYGDIRDLELLKRTIQKSQSEIIFHLAAQPLVLRSYKDPLETYSTNLMGTINVFEAVRTSNSIKALINVTSDKCYDNREWIWSYRENDPMGGFDPYSSSKGCVELITNAYRRSFFIKQGVLLASARAGNVIGGGDWSEDRLIPDLMRAIKANERLIIRNPNAIRPWQHVLDPILGYLLLAEKLYNEDQTFADGWNFGPEDQGNKCVEDVIKQFLIIWHSEEQNKNDQNKILWEIDRSEKLHEANYLKLDCSKAKYHLNWKPRWKLNKALKATSRWYHNYFQSIPMREFCLKQIEEFQNDYN